MGNALKEANMKHNMISHSATMYWNVKLLNKNEIKILKKIYLKKLEIDKRKISLVYALYIYIYKLYIFFI